MTSGPISPRRTTLLLREYLGLEERLLFNAVSRSVSPENPTGGKGEGGKADPWLHEGTMWKPARKLGRGWKVSPFVNISGGEEKVLADISGSGVITHLWMTAPPEFNRNAVLRMYWDGEDRPSVEVPYGDFFCDGWGQSPEIRSLAVCINPERGYNAYWPMPFRNRARITLANDLEGALSGLYYEVSYLELERMPLWVPQFHASWRREHPLKEPGSFTIAQGIETGERGLFACCYLAWRPEEDGWWGEGEAKLYPDGDEFPSICTTGTEDYFCGAWGFCRDGVQRNFSTPTSGFHHFHDGTMRAGAKYGLYRWHLEDPVLFRRDFRMEMQALGFRPSDRGSFPDGSPHGASYMKFRSDIAATAFWYQTEPHAPFAALQPREEREVVG